MKAWDVYLNGEEIDTVFYDSNCDADYVRRGLIDHDGYDPAIAVRCEKTGESSGDAGFHFYDIKRSKK